MAETGAAKKQTHRLEGKTRIHPGQIATANGAFAPSPEEVSHARAVIEAFAAPENEGKGVLTVNGKMTERLHEAMARKVVAIADAIAASDHIG